MAIVTWTPLMSTGIESVDAEHQKLIGLINNFYDNLGKTTGKENLKILLEGLSCYAIFHFANEELLMHQYGYPSLELHKKEHVKFTQTIVSYKERLNSGKLIFSVETTNFLKNWLTDHILTADKQYSEYIIKKGAN